MPMEIMPALTFTHNRHATLLNIMEGKNTRIILYFIIVVKVGLSETTAARGLKFWLQVALLAPISTA